MTFKTLEIRDEGTHIAVLAMKMLADTETQAYYIHARCGYPRDGSSIMIMMLDDGRASNDPYEWHTRGMGGRTLPIAHVWILDHYDELRDGDVVDVEYLLGESDAKKTSERYNTFPGLLAASDF